MREYDGQTVGVLFHFAAALMDPAVQVYYSADGAGFNLVADAEPPTKWTMFTFNALGSAPPTITLAAATALISNFIVIEV